MGLKFLNKKGWHTGSLRNIENVWKAEQKHEAEQRKLEELRKQIHEERERDEFRLLQEQAGIVPRQERLEFLYDSGLAVGKTSSEGFKALETFPNAENSASASASVLASASASASEPSSSKQSDAPGALFEDKPQSANDAWRKLHTDPLLMIRQREQEALARIKNNPVKMAMIRKLAKSEKNKDESHDGERRKVKSEDKKRSSSKHYSDSESDGHDERKRKRKVKHKNRERNSDDSDSIEERERKRKTKNKKKEHLDSVEDSRDRTRHHRHPHRESDSAKQQYDSSVRQKSDRKNDVERTQREYEKSKHEDYGSTVKQKSDRRKDGERSQRGYEKSKHEEYDSPVRQKSDRREDSEQSQRGYEKSKHEEYHRSDHRNGKSDKEIDNGRPHQSSDTKFSALPPRSDLHKRRGRAPQLSEEERAARLREMQMDAEVHEEQRWKRLKKADEDDAREASQAGNSRGKSFLHSVQKSVYGAEKGGSSTIEESVRRRTHFLQGRTADEGNAFRR
ncbi:unnamed protein product [Amaranthus hypochondriacus]